MIEKLVDADGDVSDVMVVSMFNDFPDNLKFGDVFKMPRTPWAYKLGCEQSWYFGDIVLHGVAKYLSHEMEQLIASGKLPFNPDEQLYFEVSKIEHVDGGVRM